MHRFFLTCFCVALPLCAQNAPVPESYQDLYSSLTTQISTFDTAVKAGWNGTRSGTLYAPQLQSANANNYTAMLVPYYYSNQVIAELDHLKALGATAVTVHLDFPILYQPFYASNPSLYQSFLSFYQQLAIDIHSRNLKMCVESVSGRPFTGNNAGAFTVYYKTLSWSAYMAGRATNSTSIVTLIQPDYLSVITEPDSEASGALQPTAGTVTGSTQLLQAILTSIHAAGPTSVQVGAGAGTWINSFTQYMQSFAATSVNYVDMHIYPINKNDLMAVLSAADTIHTAGKGVAISEAWEYKVRDNELGVLSETSIYGRDPFSFWEPVDEQFLSALADFANYKDLLFVSPFWSQYFTDYLDYNVVGNLLASTILTDEFNAAGAGLDVGNTTPTAMGWLNRVIPAPDKTPPAVPTTPTAAGVYPTSVQLSWLPVEDNVGVNAYRLYRNGTLLTTTSLVVYDDANLTPGATYIYTLSALDASGNVSGKSAPLSVQTTDTTPPSIPTGLKVTGTTKTSVSLSWNAANGIGGVGGYWILRGSSPTNMSIHGQTTTATSYTDYASPSTTYYYAIESYNPLYVASKPGNTVSATTPAH
jgi:hypothetical protein